MGAPEVNKFEEVSSDGLQKSIVEVRDCYVWRVPCEQTNMTENITFS